MKIGYVSGKYTDNRGAAFELENCMTAWSVASKLWSVGIYTICPHINALMMDGASDYNTFLQGALAIMNRCDFLVMLPGWQESFGGKAENEEASKLGRAIYNWPDDFLSILQFCYTTGVPEHYKIYAGRTLSKDIYEKITWSDNK